MGSGSSFKKQEDPEPGFFSLCPDLISSRWIPDPLLPYSVAYPDTDFFYPDGIRIRFYKARGSETIFFRLGPYPLLPSRFADPAPISSWWIPYPLLPDRVA